MTAMEQEAGTRAARVAHYRRTSMSTPEQGVLALLGRRWSLKVLFALQDRTLRFGAIRAEAGEISAKTLSQLLKQMHRHGLIERQAFAVIPPRVEYRLTDLGTEVAAALKVVLACTE